MRNIYPKTLKGKMQCFIIAEAGVNHNGSIKTARKMIDVAVRAGVDAVKFQTFNAKCMASVYAPKAEYQKNRASKYETQFGMLKRLELDADSHKELIRYCNKRDIVFISSPFDLESIDLLNRLGLEIFKIPSGELTNFPYLRKLGTLHKKVIMSTGMADLNEVKGALDVLISSGTRKKDITVLHCVTEYPAPMNDVNLMAMSTIRKAFNVNVGYSDHTLGIEVAIAAAALGAGVIEKHFTLNKDMRGPDHKISLEPDELEAMVKAIRNTEKALGNGIKEPRKREERIKKAVRKSIVAKTNISKGMRITDAMIDIKRPGTGIEPRSLSKVIGKRSKQAIKKDNIIKYRDLA